MLHEVSLCGLEAVEAATRLLQRARRADADAGIWEAADVQWWWRKARPTDQFAQRFWLDDNGPAASVLLTDFGRAVQCDVLADPGTDAPAGLWPRAFDALDRIDAQSIEIMCRTDDAELGEILTMRGLTRSDPWGIMWLDPAGRRWQQDMPAGFSIVDRATIPDRRHPMSARNGDEIGVRLPQTSLYDPQLDLAVETGGEIAGYALFWFDPVTKVGMVEPMRVHKPFQRRGLARGLLAEGLTRLVTYGAERLKVSYGTAAAHDLYASVGFSTHTTAVTYTS